MKVKTSLKFRGIVIGRKSREEFRTKRKGIVYIIPRENSLKGGRLKARGPISRSRRMLVKKARKY
jgi:ribosomal protein L36